MREVFGGEVFPCWIGGFDQGDLFFAGAVLEAFFAGCGVVDVLEALVINEAMDSVFRREAVGFAFTVFLHATEQAVGDTDVERSRTTGDDVDEVLVVVVSHGGRVKQKTKADPPPSAKDDNIEF